MLDRRELLSLMLGAASAKLLSALPEETLTTAQHNVDREGVVGKPQTEAVYSSAECGKITPAFEWLRFGEVKPGGWIRQQMLQDLREGFAGHLDQLCSEASSDSYVTGRVGLEAQNNTKSWWNAETEGNWRAGYIGLAYLSGDQEAQRKSKEYVEHILASQDADGYLGAFKPDVRYSISGELWAQACLFRGLLDYAELTGDDRVNKAVMKACDLIVASYRPDKHRLTMLNGHDLMISDVMERLYEMTGDRKYLDFMLWMYQTWGNDFHTTKFNSSTEICLPALLDKDKGFTQHGVHVLEGMRIALWLWMATGREDLGQASSNSFTKLARYVEPTGAVVSEEMINDLRPDPTTTEYEYCTIKEMQNTFESLLQKTGSAAAGDSVERIWFNAAQGARLPDGTALSYLTPDNRLQCNGTGVDGKQYQRRNKFSPTHADVAVCCNPNATTVAPLFVRGMWMRHPQSDGLAALLYGPCLVETSVRGVHVAIEQITNYPFANTVTITVKPKRTVEFPILLRDPKWSRGTLITCRGAAITRTGRYWIVRKTWEAGDQLVMKFVAEVDEANAANGETALAYGPLLFALEIPARKKVTKLYDRRPFEDAFYTPVTEPEMLALPARLRWCRYGFKAVESISRNSEQMPFTKPVLSLQGKMLRQKDRSEVPVLLIPIGNASILRRLTFPVSL